MSTEGQIIATRIHDLGIPDSDLAAEMNVSREHINRIRSGKKIASDKLVTNLQTYYNYLQEYTETATKKAPARPGNEETEWSYTPLFIIGGMFIAVFGGMFIAIKRAY